MGSRLQHRRGQWAWVIYVFVELVNVFDGSVIFTFIFYFFADWVCEFAGSCLFVNGFVTLVKVFVCLLNRFVTLFC